MAGRLVLSFLGPFRASLDDTPLLKFEYDKVRALLAYLAVEAAHPQRRETLADLFWPDQDGAAGLHSLSQALFKLRQVINDRQADPPYLLLNRETVQFNTASQHQLDVTDFQAGLQTAESHPHPRLEQCQPCRQRLEGAAELYQGDFLRGFLLDDSPGFNEWLTLRRERLHRLGLDLFHQLASLSARHGRYQQAAQYAWRQVELEPWREEAHRQLMNFLARSGQRTAALAQYDTCRRILATELGVEPTGQTIALYERIKAAGTGRPHNLPAALTPLVGRAAELEQIAERLADPDCRLLTLVGPGGAGKTRLALQAAAEQSGVYLQGVFLVSLAALPSADLLPQQIATAIGCQFSGPTDGRKQLAAYLAGKEMLLLLDNFDHLTEAAGLLVELLEAAPHLKFLVTSRERLRLRPEWLLPIQGLSYPTDNTQYAIRNTSVEAQTPKSSDYGALTLFAQIAGRLQPDFALSAATLPDVARICRLVEGMPLALELAAAWLPSHPLAEIAGAIAANLDFLTTSLRDVPERHRSVRAVFDYSWNLLPAEEQQALARLAVFAGGFDEPAARQVAGAASWTLTALVDKSLLRRDETGRYDLHELICHYSQEKAAPNLAGVQARHAAYYAGFVRQREEALRAGQQKEMAQAIGREIGNIRLAWQWAAGQGQLEQIGHLLAGLYQFYEAGGWFQEGHDAFAAATTALGRGASGLVAGQLLSRRGWFAYRLGRMETAQTLMAESQAIFEQVGAKKELGVLYNDLGVMAQRLGRYDVARQQLEASLLIRRELNDPHGAAIGLTNLGNVLRTLGEYQEARRVYQESAAIKQELGDRFGVAISLNNLGEVARALGDYQAAGNYYQESLLIRQDIGDRFGAAVALNNLGEVAQALNDDQRAAGYYQESLAIFTEINSQRGIAYSLSGLGRLAAGQGDSSRAMDYLVRALAAAAAIREIPKLLDVLADLASVLLKQGETARAAELLALVAHHPATGKATQGEAANLLAGLATVLPAALLAQATETGRQASLDEVVGRFQ